MPEFILLCYVCRVYRMLQRLLLLLWSGVAVAGSKSTPKDDTWLAIRRLRGHAGPRYGLGRREGGGFGGKERRRTACRVREVRPADVLDLI